MLLVTLRDFPVLWILCIFFWLVSCNDTCTLGGLGSMPHRRLGLYSCYHHLRRGNKTPKGLCSIWESFYIVQQVLYSTCATSPNVNLRANVELRPEVKQWTVSQLKRPFFGPAVSMVESDESMPCLCLFGAGGDDGLHFLQKHGVFRLQFPPKQWHEPIVAQQQLTCQVVLQALRAHIPMLACQGNEDLIVKEIHQVCGRIGGGSIDYNIVIDYIVIDNMIIYIYTFDTHYHYCIYIYIIVFACISRLIGVHLW